VKFTDTKPDLAQVEEAVVQQSETMPDELKYDSTVHEIKSKDEALVIENENAVLQMQNELQNRISKKDNTTLNMLSVNETPQNILLPVVASESSKKNNLPEIITEKQIVEPAFIPDLLVEETTDYEPESTNIETHIETEVDPVVEVPVLEEEKLEYESTELSDNVEKSDTEASAEFVPEPQIPDLETETPADPEIVTLQAEILEIVLLDEAEPKQDAATPQEIIKEYESHVERIAAEQPLLEFNGIVAPEEEPEKSIEKFAVYLKQTIDKKAEVPAEAAEIIELLNEVSEELAELDDVIELREVLTTEVIQKLVTLFEKLGYEKPQQAVKEYFQNSGVSEGLSILQYLASLARVYDAQETLSKGLQAARNTDNTVNRLGRILLQVAILRPLLQ